MSATCPHCNQTIRPKRQPKAGGIRLLEACDTSIMTEREVFAYFKRTAPIEDVRFYLKGDALSPELRAAFEAFEATLQSVTVSPAAIKRTMASLAERWRHESNQRERQALIDAGAKYDRVLEQWITPETHQIVEYSTDESDNQIAVA